LVATLGMGCATTGSGAGAGGAVAAQERALAEFDTRRAVIFDGPTGAPITFDALADRVASADVVLIGEIHGQPRGLACAAALFETLVGRAPSSAALSLEFFDRHQQTDLDDYLSGVTDEPAFRDATGRTAENYPPGHRAMVLAALDAGVPVIAANAPRRYVRLARTDGYDRLRNLSEAQRALFSVPDSLTGGGYRDRFYEQMAGMTGHGGPDPESADEPETEDERAERQAVAARLIESYYRGQNLWDATMADSIARALSAGRRPVVQAVGRFHVEHDGGLVQRLRALAPGAEVLVVVMVDETAEAPADDDAVRDDVIVFVGEPAH